RGVSDRGVATRGHRLRRLRIPIAPRADSGRTAHGAMRQGRDADRHARVPRGLVRASPSDERAGLLRHARQPQASTQSDTAVDQRGLLPSIEDGALIMETNELLRVLGSDESRHAVDSARVSALSAAPGRTAAERFADFRRTYLKHLYTAAIDKAIDEEMKNVD